MKKRIVSALLGAVLLAGLLPTAALAQTRETTSSAPQSGQTLPARYDGREQGIITPVKDQGSSNLCWAYSMIAASEAAILKRGIDPAATTAALNLDPREAASRVFNRGADPLGNTTGVQTSGDYTQKSGNPYKLAALFSMWHGPFSSGGGTSHPAYLMENAVYLPETAGLSEIKQAIVRYGAVTFQYNNWRETQYYNPVNETASGSSPHACTVIGWDDTIPAASFQPGGAKQNGGWLVKNSYSSHPYFYLSYDNTSSVMYAFDYVTADTYDYNYYYDGGVDDFSLGERQQRANVYQAKKGGTQGKTEYLKAVNVGVNGTASTLQVQIYTGLSSPTQVQGGTLAATKQLEISYGGYVTVPLDTPVELEQDSYFSVVVRVVSGSATIRQCQPTSESADFYSFAGSGESWTRQTVTIARVKALTVLEDGEESAPTPPADKTLTSVGIQGQASAAVPVKDSTTRVTLRASAVYSSGEPEDVTGRAVWSLGESWAGVSVADGVVTIQPAAAEGSVTVKAAFGGREAVHTLALTKAAPVPTTVRVLKNGSPITEDSVRIPASGTGTERYTADVYDQYGALWTGGVEWTLTAGGTGVSQNGGTLSIPAGAAEGTVRLTASAGAAASAEVTITLRKKPGHALNAFAQPSLGVRYGDTLTAQTVTCATGTVVYTSSDPDTVQVDAATGALTIRGAGEVTITAAVAEDQTYAAASASYTLTVAPRLLRITGLSAQSRAYEPGRTTVTLTGGTLTGRVKGDEVSAAMPTVGVMETDAAGADRTVTVTTPELLGAQRGSYALEPVSPLTVTIQRALPTGTPGYTPIGSAGQGLADAALRGDTFSVPGTVSWVAADGVTPLPATTQVLADTAYHWRFTPEDAANYQPLTGQLTLYQQSAAPDTGGGEGGGGGTGGGGTGGSTGGGTGGTTGGGGSTSGGTGGTGGSSGSSTPALPKEETPAEEPSQPTREEPRFTDVPADAYYHAAVTWAARAGVTTGTSANHFSPQLGCTRAQIVTFLWRLAGSPEPQRRGQFDDVPEGSVYAAAIAWAAEQGITEGVGDKRFAPEEPCTRAQAVALLHRASGSPEVPAEAGFRDVSAGDYYAAAVRWAARQAITNGVGNGLFGGESPCTRGEIVTFLYRMHNGEQTA